MEQMVLVADGVNSAYLKKEIDARAEEGWLVYCVERVGNRGSTLIILRRDPAFALSAKALAYLASSPDPDIAEEASRFILDSLAPERRS